MESGLLVYKLIWENLEDEGKVKLFHFYYPRDFKEKRISYDGEYGLI